MTIYILKRKYTAEKLKCQHFSDIIFYFFCPRKAFRPSQLLIGKLSENAKNILLNKQALENCNLNKKETGRTDPDFFCYNSQLSSEPKMFEIASSNHLPASSTLPEMEPSRFPPPNRPRMKFITFSIILKKNAIPS